MRTLIAPALVAGFVSAALAANPAAGQDAGNGEPIRQAGGDIDRQIGLVNAISEISSLAVVKLRRAPEDVGRGDDTGLGLSMDDVLLSGAGARTIMTGDDPDEEIEAASDRPGMMPGASGPGPDSPGMAEADTGDAHQPLREAIARNELLLDSLVERGVDPGDVVAVEVRDGTSVIVYIDES